MKYVGVTELKTYLSRYLARVEAGEELVIANRGRPVAGLVPASVTGDAEEEAYLRDLERRGIVRIGSGVIPNEFWEMERPPDSGGAVRVALQEERAEGR